MLLKVLPLTQRKADHPCAFSSLGLPGLRCRREVSCWIFCKSLSPGMRIENHWSQEMVIDDHPFSPKRRKQSCLQHAEGVQVEVARVTLPEKTKGNAQRIVLTHMRSVVVTEYCKSMSSQSGRQAHSDSLVLLICLKNLCASLALRKGFRK